MNVNMFMYYGAKIDKIDYENLTKKLGFERLYETVYSKGLTFRDVGNIGESGVYIIGREMIWAESECFELKKVDNDILFENSSITLSKEDENDIRQKLLEINITNVPQYYMFSTINTMGV